MFRSVINEYPTTVDHDIKIGMKGNERNTPCPCKSGKNVVGEVFIRLYVLAVFNNC